MIGNLGAGYGSVELILDAQSNGMQSLTLKCYPRLMHYLKANRITATIPATNKGRISKLKMTEKMVQSMDRSLMVGFRYEYVMLIHLCIYPML